MKNRAVPAEAILPRPKHLSAHWKFAAKAGKSLSFKGKFSRLMAHVAKAS